MASNQDSKFTKCTVDLEDGVKFSGIHYNPPITRTSPPFRPLIVALHGGTCSSHNFDVSPLNTASLAADCLSIPIVSINRPGYLETPLHSVPERSTYHKELARLYHGQLFPELWRLYGTPHKCTSLVILTHSLGTPAAIIAGGMYAADREPKYPLSGFIFSGWGSRLATNPPPPPMPNSTEKEKLEWKKCIMCGEGSNLESVDPQILDCIPLQDQPMPHEDAQEFGPSGQWRDYWSQYAEMVNVPIMFGIGEHDVLWQGTLEHVKEYETMFPKCPRFDGSVVRGAPHAIEWSHMAQGWYARCLGFAQEVSAWHGIKSR